MGTVFAVVAPVGVNERLLVRLTVSAVLETPGADSVYGMVMTTGDQTVGVAAVTAGFNAAQVAVEPATTVPQP